VSFDPQRELDELRTYLGPRFAAEQMDTHAEAVEAEFGRVGDERRFYRSSEAYLYDLTWFAMSQIKLPYLEAVRRAVLPGSSVLDYGCGIGSDGLWLLEAGYRVAFADFDNPSTRYLRWRLEHRGLSAPVYDVEGDDVVGDFDLVYSFDVIEHVADPYAFLTRLESLGRLVLVNFLEPEPGETVLHHRLPMAGLMRHVGRRGLRRYRVVHGFSRVVLYDPHPAHGGARVRSWLVRLTGGLLAFPQRMWPAITRAGYHSTWPLRRARRQMRSASVRSTRWK
jgi:SAM-dependent methyltransferase